MGLCFTFAERWWMGHGEDCTALVCPAVVVIPGEDERFLPAHCGRLYSLICRMKPENQV